jgi:hypothetical protein
MTGRDNTTQEKNGPDATRDADNKGKNNNDSEIVPHESTMPPPKRRLYNPVTGKYYEVQQRATEKRRRGQIKGSWSSKRK